MCSMDKPAKLPQSLIEPQPRRLSELQVGESAHTWSRNMAITDEGECYLDPESAIKNRGFSTLKVDRLEDGYHVTVIAKGTKWRSTQLNKSRDVPVLSVREDYAPELDGEANLARIRALAKKIEGK